MRACLQQRYGECIGRRRARRSKRTAGIMGIPKKRWQQRRPGRMRISTPKPNTKEALNERTNGAVW